MCLLSINNSYVQVLGPRTAQTTKDEQDKIKYK